jgi:hypothetical protein
MKFQRVSASGTSLNARSNAQTADQVKPNVEKFGVIGTGGYFYDPTAFAAVNEVRFGTSGRNILDAPGTIGINASIFRQFQMTERFRAEFRAESYNATNTPHFSAPHWW